MISKTEDPRETLVRWMRDMYWFAVEREITHMLLSLAEWQSSSLKDIELEDEHEDNIHGFDTFVDQVSRSSREYASHYGVLNPVTYNFPGQYILPESFLCFGRFDFDSCTLML